ncbi:MAG: aldose epimerase family protein [Pelobium sp.]
MINFSEIEKNFEKVIENKQISLNFIKNLKGVKVGICNYGARITHFIVPANDDQSVDIILGFKNIEDYLKASDPYHGATIGRFANRIADGKFSLDGVEYKLALNNGPNNLHGGEGFQKKIWDVVASSENTISLSILSEDGEDGFPGELNCNVQFTLQDNNELHIDYHATSDKNTVINLTNHAYFNLNGEGNGNILNHEIRINAKSIIPIDENSIPTGEMMSVENTPFDFSAPKEIEAAIYNHHQQLNMGNGFDHSFVLDKSKRDLSFAAIAKGDKTGILLEVSTTEPGMQFYSGNFLDGSLIGKSGQPYGYREGFCFETQHHPDSPNRPEFPTTILKAGENFKSTTIFRVIF